MTEVVVTFKISKELRYELDTFAINHGLSRSEVIKMAVALFLEKENQRSIYLSRR